MDETDEWIVLCTCEVVQVVRQASSEVMLCEKSLSQEVINQAMGG